MGVQLSAKDVRRVADATRVLVSPLNAPSETAWVELVGASLRACTAAERSGVILERGDVASMVGTFGKRAMEEYVTRWYRTMSGDVRRRQRGLTSWVRADVWSVREIQRTAYFREWCLPNGNNDSAGMCVYEGAGEEVAVYVSTSRTGGFPPGGHVSAMLQMMQPALAAGVATMRAMARARYDATLLDTVDSPVGLFQADGRLLHAVPQLTAMLNDPTDGATLRSAASAFVREVARRLWGRGARPAIPERVVFGDRRSYVMHLSLVESGSLGVERLCVLTVKGEREAKSATALRALFGLSPREADVALLLARGCRNKQVATRLGISEFTARRHTERVLHKLHATSRSEVAAKVL
ncbi:MAG: helix-turn-helix transcriptional regulator [Gemmatimonadaceae bacterium]